MSAFHDGLQDARDAIQKARHDLADGDLASAILNLVHANRFHAMSLGAHSFSHDGPLEHADAVNADLRALRKEVTDAATPPRARLQDVICTMEAAIAPIIRELAMPGADAVAVVKTRARNATAILVDVHDVRARARRKE